MSIELSQMNVWQLINDKEIDFVSDDSLSNSSLNQSQPITISLLEDKLHMGLLFY